MEQEDKDEANARKRKVLDATKCNVCQMEDSKKKIRYILFPIIFFLGNV